MLLLNGCGGPKPECDSLDTLNSVVKIISDDSNNALVNYAVKNSDAVAAKVSNTNTEADKLAILENARPMERAGSKKMNPAIGPAMPMSKSTRFE